MTGTNTIVAAVLFCILLGCAGGEAERPHIVLISVDTLRWDYLGAYGYEEAEISPTVDWLAENGMLFEQAVASAGTTVPSHGTMLTGLYPRQHGARSNRHGLYPETDTLARAMGDAGYATGAFMSARFMPRIGELNRGFQADNFAALDAHGRWHPQTGEETLGQLADWLDSLDGQRPIFLFLHLWEPHTPFEPTKWSRARMAGYDGLLRDGLTVEHLQQHGDEIKGSPEDLAAMRALYAGEVNLVDGVLAEFFTDWRARGLLDDSVVVFTADHGEGLGEGNRLGHGATHNEYVIRVPLIISDFRNPGARRVGTRVGTIDIAPTIADLAGLEERFDRHGYSLLDPESLDPEKPYFAEVALRTSKEIERHTEDDWYDPNALAVWVGDLKLVSRQDRQTFFAIHSGHREPQAVPGGEESIMLNYMAGLIETFRETPLDLTRSELSEDALEELQGLGYVQ